MKTIKTKVISIAAALALVFGSASALPQGFIGQSASLTTSAEGTASTATSGKIGDNITWKLKDGTLTITGTGKMYDYDKFNNLSPFYYRSDIKDVVIGSGITYIGTYMFYRCCNKTVSIPSTVTTIGKYAFNYSSVQSLDLPNGVTKIDKYAFESSSLKSVKLPNSLTSLEMSAFSGSDLKSVTLPSSIKELKSDVFGSCDELESVTLSNSLTKIGMCAFACCEKLRSINIPSSVQTIENQAFFQSGLKSINLSAGLKTIGGYVFQGSALESITIPKTVTSIGDQAFEDCAKLKKVVLSDDLETINYCMFGSCTALESVKLPAKLKTIFNYSFSGCKSLKQISIPDTVTSMGSYVFEKSGLTSITFPKGMSTIPLGALYNCKALKSAAIPSNIKKIDDGAFKDCTALTSFTIPSGVETVGIKAFDGCTNLKRITVSDSVKNVGTHAMGFTGDNKIADFKIITNVGSDVLKYASTSGIKYTALSRLAGANRYATAAKISSIEYSTASGSSVILASGRDYADALAGVPLAAAFSAPILLTDKDKLPTETLNEIKRLGAKNIFILGGTGAVSENVENTLKSTNRIVRRVAGKTRFETASEISKLLDKKLNKAPTEVFFVYGHNFADALSVSSVAASRSSAILYLNTNGEIDAATKAYLKNNKSTIKHAYIVGGEGVISDQMLNSVASTLGLKANTDVERIAGKNRYETCTKVNTAFESSLTGKSLFIAKGLDFPDALAGGVYAAMRKSPVLLADGALTDVHKEYLKQKRVAVLYSLGGTAVVPNNLAHNAAVISK